MGDLQAYLAKKYGAVKDSLDLKPKKKKMKKQKKAENSLGVRIVDDDALWQKEVKEELETAAEDAPIVVEDEELTRSKRMEMMRRKTLVSIGEQGGGWVEVKEEPKSKVRHDSPDLSPTRQKPSSSGAKSPVERRDGSPDMSPPRRRARHDSPDGSPARKGRSDSPDMSPPRRGRRSDSPDMSPPRRRARHDSPDLSPARNGRRDSPGRSKKLSETGAKSPDLSPPRRGARHDSPDISPPRRGARHDSPDISPPRRGARHDSPDTKRAEVKQGDLSPPRRTRFDAGKVKQEDLSPPRRSQRDADLSPPRRGRSNGEDLSSPRRRRNSSPPRRTGRRDSPDLSPRRKVKQEPAEDLSPPRRAGLKSASELREEIERQKAQEARRFRQLDPSDSGRGAETVYRRHGKQVALDELVAQQKKRAEKPPEKALPWGSGLAQQREAQKRQEELDAEKDKPFARTKEDLDAVLKNRVRWGDPMAHLVKQSDEELLEDFSKNEMMRESGFNVPQDIPAHSWLKRRLPAAPNRYNIRPGRHWDGVDRSTGFEQKVFNAQNQKKAQVDMAYKWSVQDM